MTSRYALMGAVITLQFSPAWLRADDQAPAKMPSIWEQDCLTGDWGGARSKLADEGVVFGLNETHDIQGNPVGGFSHGLVNAGVVEMSLDLDFQKLTGLDGSSFHTNAYYIYGGDLSARDIGNIMTVSNNAAYNSLRLYDLWYQQQFLDGKISLRVGQLAADDEFLVTNCGQTFVNAAFTWAPLVANNLASGGPGYPLATPGIRLKLKPVDEFSFMAAVFDGDPGDSSGTTLNPQKIDDSGTRIDFNQGALSMFEAAYLLNQEKDAAGLPGTYTLGGFYATKNYADVSTDGSGLSLANPASSGSPRNHSGDWGIYGMAEQTVWQDSVAKASHDPKDMKDAKSVADACQPSPASLSLFWRIGGTPADRNTVDFYTDGGLNCTGLFPGRDQDVLGLAAAYTHISDDFQQLDRDTNTFNGTNKPIQDYELAIELTYQAKIAPWWVVQPNVQYIIHPGGNISNPNDPSSTSPIPDALVLGVRTVVTF